MFCLCSGDYLGGEAYWAGGLHLYTPLPFRPGRGGFGELFRTHFFLNAGNLCNLNYGKPWTARKRGVDLVLKGTVPKEVSVVLDPVVSESRDCALLKRTPVTPGTMPRISRRLDE